MKIWVDADACPKALKEILFRAASKRKVQCTLVANHSMYYPSSRYIDFILVPGGFDVADSEIILQLQPKDLVITNDIPLASEVIAKGGFALNPRGEFFTEENVQDRLSIRDFMDSLRESGVQTGGPPIFGPKDKQNFSNQLDQYLSKNLK